MEKTLDSQTAIDFDVTDERFEIDKLFPEAEDAMLFWSRAMTMYQERGRFWAPSLKVSKKCARYARREIFTEEQRDVYRDTLNKIPVEPQEIMPVTNSLMAAIKKRVSPGTVSMEDDTPAENIAKPEVADMVLRWMQQHAKLPRRELEALRRGLCVGHPQCVWFDQVMRDGGLTVDFEATLLRWESTLPSPWFEEPDGSDIDDLIYADTRTKKQMLDAFPSRKKALQQHIELSQDPGFYKSILEEQNPEQSYDRATWLIDQILAQTYEARNGRYFVIQHAFPVETTEEVWYSEQMERAVRFPPKWNKQPWRKDYWLEANPSFDRRMRRAVKTLWVTVVGADGFVWYNGKSWYQNNGELPAAFFVPDMLDGQIRGVTNDLLPYVFSTAVAMTEGLDQVRKGTGSITFVTEGMVRHPSSLGEELTKPDGLVFLKTKNNMHVRDAVQWRDRKPNTTYLEFEERMRGQMKEVHNVNPSMMGKFGGRQSFRAKEKEIDQSLWPQAQYVENFQSFVYQVNNRLCSMMPYFLNEDQVIEIEDEFGNRPKERVNQIGYDYSGQAIIIANDLLSARYRYVYKQSDDSELSREEQMRDFLELLEATGNTLLQKAPRIMAAILQSFPNKFARQTGGYLLQAAQEAAQGEQAAAQAELQKDALQQQARTTVELMKLITPRMMLKTDAQNIAEYPEGFRLFYQWYLSQQEQAQRIAQQGLQLAGQLSPQQQPQQQIPAPQPPPQSAAAAQ